jgi:HSP20 family protein
MTTVHPDVPGESISDWPGSPLSTIHRLAPAVIPIPVEQYREGEYHVIRLELPGINSGDINVSVQTGILSVQAERQEPSPARHGSEFRYGTYALQVALPAGANVHTVTASYSDGILTIRIEIVPEHDTGPYLVPVTVT